MAAISGPISGAIEGPIVVDMLETSKSQNEQKNVTIADPGYIYICVCVFPLPLYNSLYLYHYKSLYLYHYKSL